MSIPVKVERVPKAIPISEIFGPTVQGEGALIGRPTVFVRVGGCDFRCSWCDTWYAVDPVYKKDWTLMRESDIFTQIASLSSMPILVTLSGGNPALYDLSSLVSQGQSRGYTFAMETQGSVYRDWFQQLDYLTLSPKPPSANVGFNRQKFEQCLHHPNVNLKLVVGDETDFQWAKRFADDYPDLPLTLQPCNFEPKNTALTTQDVIEKYKWLLDQVNAESWYRPTVLPQLHVMVWQNERGV